MAAEMTETGEAATRVTATWVVGSEAATVAATRVTPVLAGTETVTTGEV